MPLAETLALELGPEIAIYIIKVWLDDRKIASDTSLSLLDILRSKTPDKLAEKKGSRSFEAIGERVAASLAPILEIEWAHLPQENYEPVILAVASTLKRTPISAELLVEQRLEPSEFTRAMIAANPAATDLFSEDEKTLYKRLLDEISQNIVDIASKLPSFSERTFAEILKREDQILELVTRILEDVRIIREGSQQVNTEQAVAKFETEYRRGLVRKLDRIELFGADVSEAARQHSLSIAYVSLEVKKTINDTVQSDSSENELVIIGVNSILNESRYLLIRGQAGSGKTTLLKWIAVQAASRKFSDKLAHWNDSTPFFVRLREFTDHPLPSPEDFPRLVVPMIADETPDGWVHQQLHQGQALILIDGVDEIAVTKRSGVQEWIGDIVASFPKATVIVTSRPSAIDADWLSKQGFASAELQPMSLKDIQIFIDYWHKAVEENLQDEESKSELATLSKNLKLQIRENRSIRSLATNPLLCAMLCALHRDRRQQIPKDRIELYNACCHMLIERRDVERKLHFTEYPQLNYRQKRLLLGDLAYFLMRNGWSEVEHSRAVERMSVRLTTMQGIPPDGMGESILQLLLDRSGMIRQPVKGKVDFAHRTFQEFLAAEQAVNQDDIGFLISQADDDAWREVVILTAGQATQRQRNELIGKLIERGDKEPQLRHQLHLLAIACLETSTDIESDVKRELDKRLERLVPPQNMTEAKALASAGELALSHLSNWGLYHATTAAACIRTLAMIGGDAALGILERFAEDDRKTVSTELLKAWEYFDTLEYTRRVLSKLTVIDELRVQTLEGLEYLSNVRRLKVINHNYPFYFIPPIQETDELTDFDLSPISRLSYLEYLDIDVLGNIVSVDALSNLNLYSLSLKALGGRISGTRSLGSLTSLSGLEIWGTIADPGFGDLHDLTDLSYLVLSDIDSLVDMWFASKLPNLYYLRLQNLRNLLEANAVGNLSRLQALTLSAASGK